MKEAGVVATSDPQTALADASLVLSLVTAGDALSVAEDYAPYLMKGAIWCDMNSVAPQTKAAASPVVEQNGARYVAVAVLAQVHPAPMAVPLLLSGPAAHASRAELAACGFTNKERKNTRLNSSQQCA